MTVAAATLRKMREEIAADSALFGACLGDEKSRLGDEKDLFGSFGKTGEAGFSDLFAAACGCEEQNGATGDANPSGGGSHISGLNHYQLGIEYIFEGYLLHYGISRLLNTPDENFRLLAGDYMYARGLGAIASLEDLACIMALADLVRSFSFIHCEQLDPAKAMTLWTITTLSLAAHARKAATGNLASPAHCCVKSNSESSAAAGALSSFACLGKSVWGGRDTGPILDELLLDYPEEKANVLRAIFSKIDANFRVEA